MRTLVMLAALASTACSSLAPVPAMEPVLNPTMGDATRANIAAMAIAPTEQERANTYIPFDRERRARAIQAYRDGETPEPVIMSTRGD